MVEMLAVDSAGIYPTPAFAATAARIRNLVSTVVGFLLPEGISAWGRAGLTRCGPGAPRPENVTSSFRQMSVKLLLINCQILLV